MVLKHVRLLLCLHGGGGPQVGEVIRLGGVTHMVSKRPQQIYTMSDDQKK